MKMLKRSPGSVKFSDLSKNQSFHFEWHAKHRGSLLHSMTEKTGVGTQDISFEKYRKSEIEQVQTIRPPSKIALQLC